MSCEAVCNETNLCAACENEAQCTRAPDLTTKSTCESGIGCLIPSPLFEPTFTKPTLRTDLTAEQCMSDANGVCSQMCEYVCSSIYDLVKDSHVCWTMDFIDEADCISQGSIQPNMDSCIFQNITTSAKCLSKGHQWNGCSDLSAN